jgi:hypothetical protein
MRRNSSTWKSGAFPLPQSGALPGASPGPLSGALPGPSSELRMPTTGDPEIVHHYQANPLRPLAVQCHH